ncbi:MAG: HGxxPAAW family protein [Propionicimonas sp.]
MSESEPQVSQSPAHFIHHGRTVAAWTGSAIAGVAFVLGSIAFLLGPNWTLVWISAGLLLVALIATAVLRRAGYGQNA